MRILFIEDEPGIAEIVDDMPRAEGHEVALAGDGRRACDGR